MDEPDDGQQTAQDDLPIKDSDPSDIPHPGWNWSALFLGWVWLFGHKLWRWGILSFVVSCIICVLSQEYLGFLHRSDVLPAWEDSLGDAITQEANRLLHTDIAPWVFGIPIAEYLAILLSFVPVSVFGNKLLQQNRTDHEENQQKSRERLWNWCALAALILGPFGFVPLNSMLDRLLNALFPT